MQYQMQSYPRKPEIPGTSPKLPPNDTPITPLSIPTCYLKKKKDRKEMELVTTVARSDTILAIVMSRKETRTRIETGEKEEEEEQKEEEDPAASTIPGKNQIPLLKLPTPPTR